MQWHRRLTHSSSADTLPLVPRGSALRLCCLIASLLPLLVPPSAALAHGMELRLSRLSRGACGDTLGGNANFALARDGAATLAPDRDAYAQLVSQLALAIAPPLLAPVTTLGPRGFDLTVDTQVTGIDRGADYWQRATAGDDVATCDGRNDDVQRALVGNRLRFLKGLPLGFSLGAHLGMLHGVGLYTIGGELKLALLEGAREPWRPSLALRVAASALVGEPALSLSSSALDVLVSREFPLLRTLRLTPYFALGAVLQHARARAVDLTPNIDATRCAAGEDPVCNAQGLGASPVDFAHDGAFQKLLLLRYRALLGVWLRYGAFAFAAEGSLDLVRPDQADRDVRLRTARQWSLSFAPSLSF